MATPSHLTREILEDVFTPAELITVLQSSLGAVSNADAQVVLRVLGLPWLTNPWFALKRLDGESTGTIGDDLEWDLSDRYSNIPAGAGAWIPLAMILDEDIALDPATGVVHCLPLDGEIFVFNTTLRSFVHFLYILQKERPHFDVEWEGGGDEEFDPAGSHERVEAAMRSVDPAALEPEQSPWRRVLASVVDPEWDF